MALNSNLAYNISRVEDRAEREQLRSRITPRKAAKPSEAPVAAFAILILALMGGLILLCVYSKADIATVHAEIIKEEAAVKELEQENTRMKTELEQKSSQKAVEAYAENVLGMQKLEKSQIEYVSLESGNVIEVADRRNDVFADIKDLWDSVVEYFKSN